MGISLGEVLALDVLNNASVITTTFDPHTPVESITIMEAPDVAQWLDHNNIVLTGLYTVWDDESKMKELLNGLYSGNICAMFIKVNRFVEQVPQCIIDVGNMLGIAVVTIPPSIRYIDIMYPVIAAIFDSQVINLSYFKQTLNSLSSLALSNKGIKSVANLFSEIISNPVIIYDNSMDFIYTTDPRFQEIISYTDVKECVSGDINYRILTTKFAGTEGVWSHLLIPVCVFSKPKIYLSIVEANHPTTEMDFIAIENVITVFGFELMKDYAEEEAERLFQNQLIDDIRRGRNLDSLKERLRSIRFNADSKYAVIIVETPLRPISKTPVIVNQQLVDDDPTKACDIFVEVKRAVGLSGFEAQQPDGIVAVIEQPFETAAQVDHLLAKLCKQYLAKLQEAIPNFCVNIGYCSEFRDILQAQELYQSAKYAAHIGKLLYGENSCCDYEQLGVLKLLGIARNREELSRFIPSVVAKLWEHEKQNGPGLMETLECYFRYNCNAQKTAKALFIHYKTLYYRLAKIRDISGIDLKDSGQILEVQIGLMVARLLAASEEGNPQIQAKMHY